MDENQNQHETLESLFDDIADSIREKTGNPDLIKADDFPDEIRAIPGGNLSPSSLAPTFSTETAYSVGDPVMYDGQLYFFIADHAAGAWNSEEVEEHQLAEDLVDVKSAITGMTTATASDEGKALKAKTVSNGKVTEWEFGETGGGSGLSSDVKAALLACFEHVAWIDDDGQDYYDALEAALYPSAGVSRIDAVYTQTGTVYNTDALDSLKTDLVVTAYYANGTSEVLSSSAYTLTGALTTGTSVITVTYSGKTDTFTVQVTGSSGMDGWTDGVAYRNLEVVKNEYCRASDGAFLAYNGWDRTGYVPCNGAVSITFPPMTGAGASGVNSNRFFDQNHAAVSGELKLSATTTVTRTVPSGAYYFVLSGSTESLAACLAGDIVPHGEGV